MSTDQTQMEPLSHRETTSRIIGAAFEVHNTLGHGFLEKVYQRAMQVELIKRGSSAETETSVKVLYKNAVVGEYYADLRRWLRDRRDQSSEVLPRSRRAQLLNQLKATGIKSGACKLRT
jgi:GxxExxY protein